MVRQTKLGDQRSRREDKGELKMKVSFKVLLLVVLCAFVLAGCHGSGQETILDNSADPLATLSVDDLYISPGEKIIESSISLQSSIKIIFMFLSP